MAPAFLHRWLHRSHAGSHAASLTSASAGTGSARTAAAPSHPGPWPAQWLERLHDWWPDSTLTYRAGRRLRPALHQESVPPSLAITPMAALVQARVDFLQALSDVPDADCAGLRGRITHAQSLASLWHWRAEVYAQVSLARDQREAQLRLQHLNRHFPTATTLAAQRQAPTHQRHSFEAYSGHLR